MNTFLIRRLKKSLKPPFARQFASSEKLKTTPLHAFHIRHGGKMVPFGGWDMPVEYKSESIMVSTQHTRKGASLFDVSHMGQLRIWGDDRVEYTESIIAGSVNALKQDQTRYSLITNDKAGIIDDCVVTRRLDHIYMVINASRVEEDMVRLNEQLEAMRAAGKDVSIETLDDQSLVAIQGPKASAAVQALTDKDLSELKFFYICDANILGIPCQVSRSGYTGEDGFEIAVTSSGVEKLCEALLEQPDVKLAGLGARDALRLEAGLCLYGNDLDETTTPVEADLMWTISKKRRNEGVYPGCEVVREQLSDSAAVTRKRVGLVGGKGPVPRAHMPVYRDGEMVGEVTSGGFSPCLQLPIAMAYVHPKCSKPGTELQVQVRKKMMPATVSKLPFVA